MTTNREMNRFITNLPDDDFVGFEVLEKLITKYDWIMAVITPADIKNVFQTVIGRPITETEYDLIKTELDFTMEDSLLEVAMDMIHKVCSRLAKGIQEP